MGWMDLVQVIIVRGMDGSSTGNIVRGMDGSSTGNIVRGMDGSSTGNYSSWDGWI